MNIWLVTIGEPVPVEDAARDRLHRTGAFARFLAERGHEVTWWTSTFDHFRKKHWFADDARLRVNDRLEIRLLHGCGYGSNVSLARFRDHYQIGRKYAAQIERESPPDVIVAALPTIELSLHSVRYGRRRGIPVVLDVRDLWPDIFVDVAPGPARPLARLVLWPFFHGVRAALRDCTAVVGVSDGYLEWGLRYAGRTRRATDAVFPLGYRRPTVEETEVAKAAGALRDKGVDPSRAICWFIGMFGRTYDLRTVIDAARKLPAVQFVLSGKGDDYEELLRRAAGLDNVVFTGWLDAPQIAAMLRMAQVGLMAYAKGAQGLPNKLFEYLSGGIPIVSCLRGETESLLAEHDCGLTYDAGDADTLVEAVQKLVQDDVRRRAMGGNCQRLFEERFRLEGIWEAMLVHLQELVTAAKTQGPQP